MLIDEIETGLHKKYYDKLFPVVFELAKKLNVQLFIATHSMEAIDAILEYGKYENDTNSKDSIKVVTLKKSTQTMARELMLVEGVSDVNNPVSMSPLSGDRKPQIRF